MQKKNIWIAYLMGFLFLTIAFHFIVLLTSKVEIAGLFLTRPEVGYSWKEGSQNQDIKFLWQSQKVLWQPGNAHSEYNAETTDKEGIWQPLPGYKFVDESQGLTTIWEAGLLHPDFKAWSDTGEGLWIPATGYKFVFEGDEFVATEWDPGQRYEDLKIISLPEVDSFMPFQGYQFINPGKTFDVKWTPGLLNTDNPRLVSGTKEGSWEIRPTASKRPSSNDWLSKEIAKRVIYHVF